MPGIRPALFGIACFSGMLFNGLAPALALDGPEGWSRVCARFSGLCNRREATVPTTVGPLETKALDGINRAVNSAIRPRRDREGTDVWSLSPRMGDCEDYALTKKWQLLQRGWDPDSLRFATVLTESDELHLVLAVDTAKGRLILDNRFDEVKTLGELEAEGYHLLAVEGSGKDGAWKATPYAGVAALMLSAAP